MQDKYFHVLAAGASFTKKRQREDKAPAAGGKGSIAPSAPAADEADRLAFFHAMPPLADAKEVAGWRKAYSIDVDGEDATHAPLQSFRELQSRFHVNPLLLDNLVKCEWAAPTLVQSEAMPVLLARRDLIACAPTGSGKTAAFVLPMLVRLGEAHVSGGPRALIIAPSRELAEQVHSVAQKLAAGTGLKCCLLNSERSAKPQKWKNNGSWDVVVATPMRLLKLVSDGLLSLATVEYLVLDEADRLFESDFVQQADAVFAACSNPALTRAMFSATVGERPERLARAVMFSPVRVIVGGRVATLSNDLVKQDLVFVGTEGGKLVHFRSMLQEGLEPPVLIFMQNRERADELFRVLQCEKINVDMLTADRSETQRKITVKQFRQGIVWVLITTDVLGRGIDFKGVNVVINWDCPKSMPDYVHRIGRTGRVGRPGRAVTYFEEVDVATAKSISHLIRNAGGSAPEWLLNTPLKELLQRKDHSGNRKGAAKKYRGVTVDPPRQSILHGSSSKSKSKKKAE
jgi:ATP-dependent RNA helicase DDX52/ROK1